MRNQLLVAQCKNNSFLFSSRSKDEARMYLVVTYLQCVWSHTMTYRVDREGRQAGAPVAARRGGVHGQDILQRFGKLFTKGFLRGSPKVGRRNRCRQCWWRSGRSTEREVRERGERKRGSTNRHATATLRLRKETKRSEHESHDTWAGLETHKSWHKAKAKSEHVGAGLKESGTWHHVKGGGDVHLIGLQICLWLANSTYVKNPTKKSLHIYTQEEKLCSRYPVSTRTRWLFLEQWNLTPKTSKEPECHQMLTLVWDE